MITSRFMNLNFNLCDLHLLFFYIEYFFAILVQSDFADTIHLFTFHMFGWCQKVFCTTATANPLGILDSSDSSITLVLT